MELKSLSDATLLSKTKELAQRERDVTLQVLHHLREVERRILFATLSYSSLFEYAVKELKYSEGAAQRRISSMRLLREMPEIEKKIETGALSLSALSQAQVFFRQEKDQFKTRAQKNEVILSLENKSSREVERELVSKSSEPQKLFSEKVRAVSESYSELKILVEDKLLEEIEELRGLLAHRRPHASIKDLIEFAVERALGELRPKAPKNSTAIATVKKLPPAPAVKAKPTRYLPVEVKRQVWQRDKGACSYIGSAGTKCCSKHGLEYDHIQPFALEGQATVENIRLRCRSHNQLSAVHSFGVEKIAQYMPRLS